MDHDAGTRARRRRSHATVRQAFDVVELGELFRGLGDPTRLRILNVLAAGELCVCDVVELLDLVQPTVSRHLAVLRRCGLVEVSRASRFAHYRLAPAAQPLRRQLLSSLRARLGHLPSLGGERRAAAERVRRRRERPC